MAKWFLIFVLVFSLPALSQIQGESEVYLSGDLIEPQYEGGFKGFQGVFYQMIKDKKVKRGEKVTATFVIGKDGLMTSIKITSFKDDETAMSVLQTLNDMNALKIKWQPATRLGEFVPIKLEFPFRF
jgi:hypothetical protein